MHSIRTTRFRVKPLIGALALGGLAFPMFAQAAEAARPVIQAPVVVTATRIEQSSFDLPVSVDVIASDRIHDGQPEVNLSESLVRVPGVVVQNRQNYAQDLQISARGFGTRSTFGVRGVRLYTDGIPATMPDGQGQAATINLDTAERIEVMRGPFSALYGNSSGGVIQAFTADGPKQPTVSGSLKVGSYDTSKVSAQVAGQQGSVNYVADISRFDTDGYREHSAATRDHFNGKLKFTPDQDTTISVLGNALRQPDTQDPLGLSASELSNPKQATANATIFNTRKSVENNQGGVVYEKQLSAGNSVRAMGYYGGRKTVQFQAIPDTVQRNAAHPGGVIDLDREFGGVDLRWTHKGALAGQPLNLTVGVNYDRMEERRQGFQNFIGTQLGVKGQLKRKEDNTATNTDEYVQAEWQASDRWLLSAGARNSVVRFDSKDLFVIPGNGNDSGSTTYRNTSPVAGVTFRVSPAVNLYASYGKGFETPTLNEIAYKSTSGTTTGLNFALRPSRSHHYEAGTKMFLGADTRLNVALFQVDTEDEIATLSNSGGRSVFQNVGKTERKGMEIALDAPLTPQLTSYAAFTYLEATYEDTFSTPGARVNAGNRLPGAPRSTFYGEIAWKDASGNFSTALETRVTDKVYANDTNTASAPGYGIVNWRASVQQKFGTVSLSEFVRVENLFDKQYIGSVMVNESNARYYEPAPGRNYMVGVNVAYRY